MRSFINSFNSLSAHGNGAKSKLSLSRDRLTVGRCKIILVLAAIAFASSAPLVGSVPVGSCGAVENEPENLLSIFQDFEYSRFDIPPCGDLAEEKVRALAHLESVVLILVSLGLLAVAIRIGGSWGGVLGGILACGLFVVGIENSVRITKINSNLTSGYLFFEADDYGSALEQLSRASSHQESSWLRHVVPWAVAVEKPKTRHLREGAGVCAVGEALEQGSAKRAVAYLDDFPIVSAGGRAASLAALSHHAWQQLEAGETAAGLVHSQTAARVSPRDPAVVANLEVATYLHAVTQARSGLAADALTLSRSLNTATSTIEVWDQLILRGFAARWHARELLADPGRADTAGACETLAEAHAFALEHQLEIPFLNCDYAGALEAHAVVQLRENKPKQAVASLDTSDQLVPERELVRLLRPKALLVLGTRQLSDLELEEAIATLNRADQETAGRDPDIRQALALAWMSRGSQAHEEGNRDEAIEAFLQAHRASPRDPNVQHALGEAFVGRADSRLETGDIGSARSDYQKAAHYSPGHNRVSRNRLAYIPGMVERIRRINGASNWLNVPAVAGEVPKDIDGDGQIDRVAYYDGNSAVPVALGKPVTGSFPWRLLVLTNGEEQDKAVAIVRDLNRDGSFDERTDYEGGEVQGLLANVDADYRPDVRVHFKRGFEFEQEALSGRVLMQIRGGVIGEPTDFFTEPDAYVILRKNYRTIGRTRADQDSYFPIWHEGIVLDYRFGDEVQLELWDEDLFSDDHLGTYRTQELPKSGVYRFPGVKAALNLRVTPSTLPEGHHILMEPPEVHPNVFRDNPTSVPEVADIIAGAHSAQETTEAIQWVTTVVVTQVLLPRLLPEATFWQQWIAELVVEKVVLDPIFKN